MMRRCRVPVIEEEEVLDGIQDEFVQRLHHSHTQVKNIKYSEIIKRMVFMHVVR